ncbi:hypothetical protein CASFOL_015071 [Castilleja foliolosa]|uniref:Uncharacterized protein n=1 Tax=Castilleja foliolosa TaxID=1961234 RepID=A0ABD3DD28_9LAMI
MAGRGDGFERGGFDYDNSRAVANLSEFTVMVVADSATQQS